MRLLWRKQLTYEWLVYCLADPRGSRPHAQIHQPGAGIESSPAVFRLQLLLWSEASDGEKGEPRWQRSCSKQARCPGKCQCGNIRPLSPNVPAHRPERSTKPMRLRVQDCGRLCTRGFQDWQDPHPQGAPRSSSILKTPLRSPKYGKAQDPCRRKQQDF